MALHSRAGLWMVVLVRLRQECCRHCFSSFSAWPRSFRLGQAAVGGDQDTVRVVAVVLPRVLQSVPWMIEPREAE